MTILIVEMLFDINILIIQSWLNVTETLAIRQIISYNSR